MIKKIINGKAAILALTLTLAVTFFIGCFANPPENMDASFTGKYWYYINRGYPKAWAGLKLANSQIDFPLITMPFLSVRDDRGTKLEKIVNLNIVLSILLNVFLISYIPTFIFAKAVDENKKLTPYFKSLNLLVLGVVLFIYFALFPLL